MTVINGRFRSYSSTANLGSGFDVVAVALDAFYDEASFTVRIPGSGNVSVRYVGPYANQVRGNDIVKYLIKYILSKYSLRADVEVTLWKGVPPGKGLGSSGASASLTVRALNDLLNLNLSLSDEALIAGEGEALVAGTPHYDNVAASLAGGAVIVGRGSNGELIIRELGMLKACFIISIPEIRVPENKTGVMRSLLPKEVPLGVVVRNYFRLANLVMGLIKGDLRYVGLGMEDLIVVPIRSKYSPCYDIVKERALRSGAYGFTLSGAGPSTIAVADQDTCASIAREISKAYRECGVRSKTLISGVARGVHRIE